MNEIIIQAIQEIQCLSQNIEEGKHIATGDIRKLSSALYKKIENKNINNVLVLCEDLLELHSWELGVIAYDWAYKVRKQYTKETYDVFYSWLKKYVRSWGDCDDFCTHAFAELLRKEKTLFPEIIEWTKAKEFWIRRASAVILIPAIAHNDYDNINPLIISDALMEDEHDLVRKGYGWMLKVLSKVERDTVKKYLIANHARMPRVAYRYALEKFDKETKTELMNL